ncbi:hypothetical protein BpHYR1_029544 [Brachionus plicatilis]|uniref:Uncharacterized protein n=1 Tax=Brachionus plicatilis TaxID=10195 RepID=A0A3M7R803_BRAPC|nr:hypothetical protein BpHYR1_029544 [Brachionus plicatilis]
MPFFKIVLKESSQTARQDFFLRNHDLSSSLNNYTGSNYDQKIDLAFLFNILILQYNKFNFEIQKNYNF